MAVDNILSYFLPKEIICQIFSKYLSTQDISRLDVTVCNHKKRPFFLECIKSIACIWPGDKKRQLSCEEIAWLRSRNMKIKHLNCDTVADNTAALIAGFGIHLEWLNIDKQCVSDMSSVSDMSMIRIAEDCPNIKHLSISGFRNITDSSIIKIAEYCYNLKELNLSRCRVTDRSMIRIAEGCHNMECLHMSGCKSITDVSVVKIAENCLNMKDLNLSECNIRLFYRWAVLLYL
jgi:hypothetical protein